MVATEEMLDAYRETIEIHAETIQTLKAVINVLTHTQTIMKQKYEIAASNAQRTEQSLTSFVDAAVRATVSVMSSKHIPEEIHAESVAAVAKDAFGFPVSVADVSESMRRLLCEGFKHIDIDDSISEVRVFIISSLQEIFNEVSRTEEVQTQEDFQNIAWETYPLKTLISINVLMQYCGGPNALLIVCEPST